MIITSAFDSGNIIVKSAHNTNDIHLDIRRDHNSEFFQWFHFRVSGVIGDLCNITIDNAGKAAYVEGFENYEVCASYNRESWFRIPTKYNGETLSWSVIPNQDSVYFAYFAPYSMERHADLIADVSASPLVRTHVLGHTLDGQDIDMIEIGGTSKDKKPVWLIARQHPGETMAQWWMEGALDWLLDSDNPNAKALISKAQIYVVPNMNPDGSKRGHLRTNAAGANLNREWANPTLENSPEVYHVLAKMRETGMVFNLDVHGDEALPYNFIAGFEGIPNPTQKMLTNLETFKAKLCDQSPDFQRKYGYPIEAKGKGNMTVATNAIAEEFQCLAMTLEMPFKDNADMPDQTYGWSPERCRHLGAACMHVLGQMIDNL